MTMIAKLLDCYDGEGEGAGEDKDYKRMAVLELGEMRGQQIASHLSRLRLYNHAPDPFKSPIFRVH